MQALETEDLNTYVSDPIQRSKFVPPSSEVDLRSQGNSMSIGTHGADEGALASARPVETGHVCCMMTSATADELIDRSID